MGANGGSIDASFHPCALCYVSLVTHVWLLLVLVALSRFWEFRWHALQDLDLIKWPFGATQKQQQQLKQQQQQHSTNTLKTFRFFMEATQGLIYPGSLPIQKRLLPSGVHNRATVLGTLERLGATLKEELQELSRCFFPTRIRNDHWVSIGKKHSPLSLSLSLSLFSALNTHHCRWSYES